MTDIDVEVEPQDLMETHNGPAQSQQEATELLLDIATARIEAETLIVLANTADRFVGVIQAAGNPVGPLDAERLRQIWEEESARLVVHLADLYAAVAKTAARSVSVVARVGGNISALRQQYLTTAANRLNDVGDDLWKSASQTLADGNLKGEGYDQLRKRLQDTFAVDGRELGNTRANRIARTEVQSAVNRGTQDGVASLSSDVRPMYKVWLATYGGRTRPEHARADGQIVPMDQPFTVGGELLQYPGDPAGSAGTTINCRCTTIYTDDPEFDVNDPNRESAQTKVIDYCGNMKAADGSDYCEALDGTDSDRATLNRVSTNDAEELRLSAVEHWGQNADQYSKNAMRNYVSVSYNNINEALRGLDPDAFRRQWSLTSPIGTASKIDEAFDLYATTSSRPVTLTRITSNPDPLAALTPDNVGDSFTLDSFTFTTTQESVPLLSGKKLSITVPENTPMLPGSGAMGQQELILRPGTTVRLKDVTPDGVAHLDVIQSETQVGTNLYRDLDSNNRAYAAILDSIAAEAKPTQSALSRAEEVRTALWNLQSERNDSGLSGELSDDELENLMERFLAGELSSGDLVAAADNHDGAMIALVPSEADLDRLVLEGGEPREELHLTLMFLGPSDEIPADALDTFRSELEMVADQLYPIEGEAFAASMFNPNGEHPCWVLTCGGEKLSEAHLAAISMASAGSDSGWSVPEQHSPWVAHITLAYTDDEDLVDQVTERVGPITFDRLRLAVGGEVTDYPLGATTVVEQDPSEEDDMSIIEASNTETVPEMAFSSGRIRGLTLCDIPAFIEAFTEVTGPADENGFVPVAGVAAVEGIGTGDGRIFEPGAFRWEGDSWPFRWDIEDDGMHLGAVTVGTLTSLERDGEMIRFTGRIDTSIPNGAAAAGLIERGTITGVSVDLDDIPEDSVEIDYVLDLDAAATGSDDLPLAPDDTEWDASAAHNNLAMFAADMEPEGFSMFMAATHFWRVDDGDAEDPASYLLPFADVIDGTVSAVPAGVDWAIAEADRMWDDGEITADDFTAITANASDYLERLGDVEEDDVEIIDEDLEATAWSQFADLPALPAGAFDDPSDMLADTGQSIGYENGRIYGWVAQAGVCHDAFSGSCVTPPKKGTDLDTFNRQPIKLDDGTTIKVGVFTMDAGHDNDGAEAGSLKAQFDDTRTVAGLVRVGINDGGTWFSGVAAPWLSDWDRQVLTACRPSGHWKRLRSGRWSLRAVLSVPVPGFPNRVAASAAVDRSNMALVASASASKGVAPDAEVDQDDFITLLASAVADEIERRQSIRIELASMEEFMGGVRSDLVASMRKDI